MTKEHALKLLKDEGEVNGSDEFMEAYWMAISALEQEPCEDTISREAVKQEIKCWIGSGEHRYAMSERFLFDRINELPSVQPSRKGHWILADEQNKEDVENDNYRIVGNAMQI